MPLLQLHSRRRRRARPAEIHAAEAAHHVAHAVLGLSAGGGAHVEQAHHVSHAARRRTAHLRRSRAAGGLLGRRRGRAVEVDVEQVLYVALRRSPVSSRPHRRRDWVLGQVLALLLDRGSLDLVGAEAALADEGLRGLVVDGGERR